MASLSTFGKFHPNHTWIVIAPTTRGMSTPQPHEGFHRPNHTWDVIAPTTRGMLFTPTTRWMSQYPNHTWNVSLPRPRVECVIAPNHTWNVKSPQPHVGAHRPTCMRKVITPTTCGMSSLLPPWGVAAPITLGMTSRRPWWKSKFEGIWDKLDHLFTRTGSLAPGLASWYRWSQCTGSKLLHCLKGRVPNTGSSWKPSFLFMVNIYRFQIPASNFPL